HGEVSAFVGTNNSCLLFSTVFTDHRHLGCVRNDVVIGDDIAVSRDDEARASSLETARTRLFLRARIALTTELVEEIAERMVFRQVREVEFKVEVAATALNGA